MATNFKEMGICLMILIKIQFLLKIKFCNKVFQNELLYWESNIACLLSPSRNKFSTVNKLILMIFRDATCIRRKNNSCPTDYLV